MMQQNKILYKNLSELREIAKDYEIKYYPIKKEETLVQDFLRLGYTTEKVEFDKNPQQSFVDQNFSRTDIEMINKLCGYFNIPSNMLIKKIVKEFLKTKRF